MPVKSPADIQKHLRGVRFPASKQDLMDKARENGAPDDVVNALQSLSGNQFSNPQEVMRALSNGEE